MTRRTLLLGLLTAGGLGCKRTASTKPAKAAARPEPDLPSPDPSRMMYDAETGVLTLHPPPRTAEWTVRDDTGARYPVVELRCQLPENVDPSRVEIFYVVAGGRSSNAIRLRNVVAAHMPPPDP